MSVDRSAHWIARNNPMGGYGRRQSSSVGGDAMVTSMLRCWLLVVGRGHFLKTSVVARGLSAQAKFWQKSHAD